MSRLPFPHLTCRAQLVVALSASSLLPACAADPSEDRGDVVLVWEQGGGRWGEWLRASRVLDETVAALNRSFKLPEELRVIHAPCGEENAFYDSWSRELTMCYELLEAIAEIDSEQDRAQRIQATWRFIFLHELGHALVDFYSLPVASNREDAADNFAALQLIRAGQADDAYLAAEYWRDTDPGRYDAWALSDEHSLNPQRFYNIVCQIYGAEPRRYHDLVSRDLLPGARAKSCPSEYREASSAWDQLLGPWIKR